MYLWYSIRWYRFHTSVTEVRYMIYLYLSSSNHSHSMTVTVTSVTIVTHRLRIHESRAHRWHYDHRWRAVVRMVALHFLEWKHYLLSWHIFRSSWCSYSVLLKAWINLKPIIKLHFELLSITCTKRKGFRSSKFDVSSVTNVMMLYS